MTHFFTLFWFVFPSAPSGITSWPLSAFWSLVQWKCSERKEKVFFASQPVKISKKILLSRRGSCLISKKVTWFQDSVFDLSWLSDCRILDRDVGMALHQSTAEVCPGFVSRKARSALLGFFGRRLLASWKVLLSKRFSSCFAQNTD